MVLRSLLRHLYVAHHPLRYPSFSIGEFFACLQFFQIIRYLVGLSSLRRSFGSCCGFYFLEVFFFRIVHKHSRSVGVVAFSSFFFPSHATKSVCRSVVCCVAFASSSFHIEETCAVQVC
jgi:hypothetical protein